MDICCSRFIRYKEYKPWETISKNKVAGFAVSTPWTLFVDHWTTSIERLTASHVYYATNGSTSTNHDRNLWLACRNLLWHHQRTSTHKLEMDSSNMQCYCGKNFYQLNAYSNHQRHCKSSQERLTSALTKAQQIWSKKRVALRLQRLSNEEQSHGTNDNSGHPCSSNSSNSGRQVSIPISVGQSAEPQRLASGEAAQLQNGPEAETGNPDSSDMMVVCNSNILVSAWNFMTIFRSLRSLTMPILACQLQHDEAVVWYSSQRASPMIFPKTCSLCLPVLHHQPPRIVILTLSKVHATNMACFDVTLPHLSHLMIPIPN